MAKKENFHPYYIGTEHGRLSFGEVRVSNEISACMLQSGPDGGRHYITMEETGSAAEGTKGSTKVYCPGTFTVKTGKDIINYPPKRTVEEVEKARDAEREATRQKIRELDKERKKELLANNQERVREIEQEIFTLASPLQAARNTLSDLRELAADPEKPRNIPAIWYEAENGDIIIKAPRGRIKLEAESIELTAKGFDGRTGNILMDADDKIALKAQIVDVNSRVSTKIFSESTVDMIGKGIMNIYGGLTDFADRTTKGSKPSKTCGGAVSINEERNK